MQQDCCILVLLPGIVAGNRFRFMQNKIPFGYNELVQALVDAIEEEGPTWFRII